MKISKITSILVIASLLIVTLLSGCTTKEDDKSSTSEVSKISIIANWAVENSDENKIYFSYPRFEGDTEHSVKMNEQILDFVKSTLQHSRFRDFNGSFNNLTKGVEQENDHYTDLSADIEYEVLRNDSEYFSVKFEGLCIYKGAAYPTNYFTSLIIDVENYELVALSDLYNVDVEFTEFIKKKFKEQIRADVGVSSSDEYLLKSLQQMEKNNDYGFHSFMTEDEMGVSVPLVHALGDHIEIMISYDELAPFLKTYYTEIEIKEISDITFSDETTEDDETIHSSFKYIPFSESHEIGEILNNNPIDKLCFEETKEVVTTKDMVDIYQKYLDVWQNELDIAVEIIEKNIPKEDLENFQISQEAWESFYETNPNIAVDIYSVNMGMGSIFHIIYGEKALHMKRYRTLELAEYCYLLTGSFEFEFSE